LAAWMGSTVTSALPVGCSSTAGFSASTGLPCNSATVSTYPAGCTSNTGYSSTTGASCATTVALTYPAGCTSAAGYSPTTGASCATGATTSTGTLTAGTDGSITGSTSSYVSSGIQVKKGETKDVVAVRLQAVAGPVQVTRVTADFGVRPWLFFSKLDLHDSNGKVIATKVLSDSTSSTEVTVGSDYQVQFDNLNYVVTPGTTVDLAVDASVLSATDKITNGMTLSAAITNIRTINGVGYTDTVSNLANWPATSSSTAGTALTTGAGLNYVSLTSTGSVADIYARISPNSPVTGQQVVSTTQTTSGVTLGIFSVKSANNSSTLNTLAIDVHYTAGNGSSPALASAFSNYRLFVNGSSVAGGSLSGSTLTFSNMTVPLAQDTWVDLTVEADASAIGTTVTSNASVYLGLANSTSNPVVTDANYGTTTSEGGTPLSNVLTLTASSLNVTNATASLGSAITQSNSTVGYNATYSFTLTNNSNNDLYVSATPATVTPISTNGSTGSVGTSGLTSVTVSPSTLSGDYGNPVTAFDIPASSSRTFSFSGVLRNVSGGSTTLYVSSIVYGTAAGSPTGQSITSGLSGLKLTAAF
jgi:collagen type VII alpha